MATAYKVLGQSAPAATTNTTLYTVPASTSAVVSTLTVCNTSATALTYRVAVRPAGASIVSSQYIIYDNTLQGNDSVFLTIGLSLATTDVVTVYTSAATATFNLYGSEIT
jgi:hypothetical protein